MDHHFVKHNKELLDLFFLHFREAKKHQGMDDIHQLRVTIKKLRASWLFLEKASEGRWIKKPHYDMVRELFARAGIVRELQVNLAMLRRQHSKYLDPYKANLQSTLKAEKKKLKPYLRSFSKRQFSRLNKELHAYANTLHDDELYSQAILLLRSLFTRIRVMKAQLPGDDTLHKIRIRLKKVSEILIIMVALKPSGRLKKFLGTIKAINKQTGRWHDDVVLIESIESYIRETASEGKAYKQLNKFMARLQLEKEKRENKIYMKLEDLLAGAGGVTPRGDTPGAVYLT